MHHLEHIYANKLQSILCFYFLNLATLDIPKRFEGVKAGQWLEWNEEGESRKRWSKRGNREHTECVGPFQSL